MITIDSVSVIMVMPMTIAIVTTIVLVIIVITIKCHHWHHCRLGGNTKFLNFLIKKSIQ